MYKMGYSILLFMILALIVTAIYKNQHSIATDDSKLLDLQKIPTLTKRDANWLIAILKGEKYETLAIDSNVSIGTVKNRLKFIYKILGVDDKQDFVDRYSEFEICFGEELFLRLC